jgi:hypothetical protein
VLPHLYDNQASLAIRAKYGLTYHRLQLFEHGAILSAYDIMKEAASIFNPLLCRQKYHSTDWPTECSLLYIAMRGVISRITALRVMQGQGDEWTDMVYF